MSLSYIELLPTELIQPIFLDSGPNLALTLASPCIAAKLSHERIYETVCTHYLTQSLIHDPNDSRNQTWLFAAKWLTWDFFTSFILMTYKDVGCICGKTTQRGCFDAQWPPKFEDATAMTFSRSHWPALTFVKCRMPVKLLHGPWTQDKVQFLRFLLWKTSMTVDWANPEVLEIVRGGKRQLFNHKRRLGKSPSLEQVRLAVIEAGCERSIVYDTMASARSSGLKGDEWNCDELDKWCEQRIEAGDPKGQWLKVKLQELRHTSVATWEEIDGTQTERMVYGIMQPETGDYDHNEGDKLIISDLKWNKELEPTIVSIIRGSLILGPRLDRAWKRGKIQSFEETTVGPP